MRYVLLICLCFCGTALAECGVLVEHIPSGADNRTVMAVTAKALEGRTWTVESINPTSVTAVLNKELLRVTVRIFMDGQTLRYEGTTRRTRVQGGPSGRTFDSVNNYIPPRWLANLKRDISLTLATIPDGIQTADQ